MKKRVFLFLFRIGILFNSLSIPFLKAGGDEEWITLQEKRVLEWRKGRDEFFRNHQRSPLTPREKRNFKGLGYYPFNPRYVFLGQIERYILHINNPKYYATLRKYAEYWDQSR